MKKYRNIEVAFLYAYHILTGPLKDYFTSGSISGVLG